MTKRFGSLVCIKCSQSGHLSYQCKKPTLPLQPSVFEADDDKTRQKELDELRDEYDQQVWC